MKKIFLYVISISIGDCAIASDIMLDYHNKSITDDEIASAIRHPRPAGISDLTRAIDKEIEKFSSSQVKSLNVSENNITLKGATMLLKYITNHLTELETLNLSFNQIRDWRGQDEYSEFEESLKILLELPSLRAVDIRTNYLGLEWYKHIISKFPNELAEKIRWQ